MQRRRSAETARRGAALALLASCTTATAPPPPPPPVARTYTAELALEDRGIGLRAADLCPGTVSGAYTVRGPGGSARGEIRDVQVSERVCVEGLGSDGECHSRPLEWILLGPLDHAAVGEYRASASALTLSCAPGRLKVSDARAVVLSSGGPLIPLAQDDPLPSPPPPPPSAPRPTARMIRQRLSSGPPPHQGRLEGLWLPIEGGGRTPWGTVHAAPRAPRAFLGEGYGPQWIEAPTPADLGETKAGLVALELAGPEEAAAGGQGGLRVRSLAVLEGARAPEEVLGDAHRRWRAHAAAETATLTATLRGRLAVSLGPQGERFTKAHSEVETLYRPTWSSSEQAFIVRYVEHHEETARAARGRRMQYCPPNRPPAQCRSVTTHAAWTARATFALELRYDRQGELRAEDFYPSEIEVYEGPE